jgi:flagellar motor switch protein FliG
MTCHKVHKEENKHLLVANERKLCILCHVSEKPVLETKHNINNKGCSSCHVAHKAKGRKLWSRDIPENAFDYASLIEARGKTDILCLSCHYPEHVINGKEVETVGNNEHPQTIALILAHMDPTSAAETLSYFPDELRAEVLIRMSNLGDISPQIIKKVSAILETKLESLTGYKVEIGGVRFVAEIFNRLGQKAAKETLKYIEQINAELAENIKEKMFTFEDIIKLDNNAIREILKEADKQTLMIALKGAPEELKQKFLSNMSQRAASAFEEEMQFLGPVKVKEVEAAQRKIVEIVQKLAEEGKIAVGAEEEVIE